MTPGPPESSPAVPGSAGRPPPLQDPALSSNPDSLVIIGSERYVMPPFCCLCLGGPVVTHGKASVTVRSAEYIVAHKTRTIAVDNIPYCRACQLRMESTSSESVFIFIVIIIAILFGVLSWYVLQVLCLSILLPIGIFVLGALLMKKVVVDRSEDDGMKLWASKNTIGFAFRNDRFARAFAAANARYELVTRCTACRSGAVNNVRTGLLSCVSCNVQWPARPIKEWGLRDDDSI